MKYCGKCKENLSYDKFGINRSRADGLQSQCKECRRSTNNDHYKNSINRREAIKRNNRIFSQKNKDYVRGVKSSGCCKCGEKEICTLDFHHMHMEKDFNISSKLYTYSIPKLKKEIQKCIVVCSNCHRKIHAGIIDQ